MQLLTKHPLLQ